MPKNVMADVNIQGNGRQLNKDINGNGGLRGCGFRITSAMNLSE